MVVGFVVDREPAGNRVAADPDQLEGPVDALDSIVWSECRIWVAKTDIQYSHSVQ